MKKNTLTTCILLLIAYSLHAQKLPVDYVNTFIGTGKTGNTNPYAQMPWGMVSVGPMNVLDRVSKGEWISSGYKHGEKNIAGFTQVNLSGTGCPDLGCVLVMPTVSKRSLVEDVNLLNPKNYQSGYTDESSLPGYYAAKLTSYGIKAEMTATNRVSISRYTFPASANSNIIVNLADALTVKKGGSIKVVSSTEIEGFKVVGGFCNKWSPMANVYFVIKLSKPAKLSGVWKDGVCLQNYNREIAGDNVGAFLSFTTSSDEAIEVKVAVSYTSINNARQNMKMEQAYFSFDDVLENSKNRWNKELSKILVEGGSDSDRTIFYTALYHILIHPSLLSDFNGSYPAMMSGDIRRAVGYSRYNVFSLWDTYRNVHPLLSLIYPEKQLDMLQSMIDMYKESGWLPKWELYSRESYVMVGDPAIPVIVDSYLRGIKDFEVNTAWEAMFKSAMVTEENGNPLRPGSSKFNTLGYIPENDKGRDNVWGSVSTGLEYCIADWNIAQFAKALGKENDYQIFLNRSMNYKNYFDPATLFLSPRLSDGSFLTIKNPNRVKGYPGATGFVEGTPYNYNFMVPHDIPGLVKLMGKKNFSERLEYCFTETDTLAFDMTNEPDIAYPYLFNYLKGEEWKTQKYVNQCIRNYFNTTVDGIPGDDDCGTMSAWLVFSMMGIYPDCPGNMNYQVSAPVFDRISIKLNEKFYTGNEMTILAPKKSADDIYIESFNVNNVPSKTFVLNHQDIVKGGIINFVLSPKR